MTLKVVNIKGGGKVVEPAPNQAPNRSENGQSNVTSATAAATARAANSEAALTSVRSVRFASVSGEKIEDYKKAKELSEDIADRVADKESGAKEAHSISEGSAKAHLLQ